jgi:hypothetical protein
VIFLDIGKILEKGGSRIECVIRAYLDFLISTFLSNSHSKYYFFRHCTKSTLIVWYFVSNKHYFIEQKRGKKKYVICLVQGKLLKRWIPWWYFTSTFISNSADGLVYPSTLSGEVLCDTLRLVWCVCVRPSLCPPPMVSRYNLRTDFKFCTLTVGLVKMKS